MDTKQRHQGDYKLGELFPVNTKLNPDLFPTTIGVEHDIYSNSYSMKTFPCVIIAHQSGL